MGKKIFENGLLIDGNGGEAKKDHIVVVDGNTIEYVGEKSGYSKTGDEEVVDVQGGTILPGLIDTHVHMMMEFMPVAKKLVMTFSLMYYNSEQYLKETLYDEISSLLYASDTDLD